VTISNWHIALCDFRLSEFETLESRLARINLKSQCKQRFDYSNTNHLSQVVHWPSYLTYFVFMPESGHRVPCVRELAQGTNELTTECPQVNICMIFVHIVFKICLTRIIRVKYLNRDGSVGHKVSNDSLLRR